MLLDHDISPNKDIYYLGSKLLEILLSSNEREVDFFAVYQKLKENEKISINLFIFVIDWLYLLGLVKKNNNGYLEKCF